MGQLRLLISDTDRLPANFQAHAYMAGLEGIPWKTVCRIEHGLLVVDRQVSESGNLFILWQVPGIGLLAIGTATLMEREQPYLLFSERKHTPDSPDQYHPLQVTHVKKQVYSK